MQTADAAVTGVRESRTSEGVNSSESSIAGLDRVSATTLEAPDTCLMSVEYWATKDRWRVWRGDFSVLLTMAPQSGLWSVKIVKLRPSR